jgi:hypothetical protein
MTQNSSDQVSQYIMQQKIDMFEQQQIQHQQQQTNHNKYHDGGHMMDSLQTTQSNGQRSSRTHSNNGHGPRHENRNKAIPENSVLKSNDKDIDLPFVNNLLGNKLDDQTVDDNVSECMSRGIGDESVDSCKRMVYDYFNMISERNALKLAIKSRERKIKEKEAAIQSIMKKGGIEIIDTKYGYLVNSEVKRKKKISSKQVLIEAEKKLAADEMARLKEIMNQQVITDVETIKIMKKV